MSKNNKSFQECCLYFTANSLSRLINKMADKAFECTGLAPSYANLMFLLIESPGLSQAEICEHMNLKTSTITRFLDKLIALGYVDKIQKGRTASVYPTKEGQALKPQIDKALEILFDDYCEILGKEFAVKLTADIHKASQILSE